MSKKMVDATSQFLDSPFVEPAIDIAFNAGNLSAMGNIEMSDSRQMVQDIKHMAVAFQIQFDPSDENRDYMIEVDAYTEKMLQKLYAKPHHEVLSDEFSIKYTPWTGETLSVLFMDGRHVEVGTAPGGALTRWNEEFSVKLEQIRDAYISNDHEMTETWLRGGPGELYPSEQTRIINGHHVYIGGTWYEVCGCHGEGVLHYGDCNEGMTPRQVYNHYYPQPENDGKEFKGVTLFFIDNVNDKILHIMNKTVKLDVFSYDSAIADQWRHTIPKGNDRRIEGYRLHVEPLPPWVRPFVWPARPRILMADGGRVTLPCDVLYMQDASNCYVPCYQNENDKLDAIAEYLTNAGIPWREM